MRSPGGLRPILLVDLYSRPCLSTLSPSGTSLTCSISLPNPSNAPARTRHFPVHYLHHKHLAPYTTLRSTNSSSLWSRFPSSPSQRPNPTSTSKAPFDFGKMQRPATPYNDPKVQGPRAQILASGNRTDLLKMMQQNTVNKTGLHPGGVQYVSPLPAVHSALNSVEDRVLTFVFQQAVPEQT